MFIKQSDLPAVMNRPEGSLTEQPAAVQENRRTLGKGKNWRQHIQSRIIKTSAQS